MGVTQEQAPLLASTRLNGGVITSSLFAATDASDIPDSVAVIWLKFSRVTSTFAGTCAKAIASTWSTKSWKPMDCPCETAAF